MGGTSVTVGTGGATGGAPVESAASLEQMELAARQAARPEPAAPLGPMELAAQQAARPEPAASLGPMELAARQAAQVEQPPDGEVGAGRAHEGQQRRQSQLDGHAGRCVRKLSHLPEQRRDQHPAGRRGVQYRDETGQLGVSYTYPSVV